MKNYCKLPFNRLLAKRQKGALTIFTAVFVLILMTLMLFYATRVGLFEQRVSSNDARQKLAFQAAEAGLDYATEYLLAANMRIISKKTEAAPDGAGNDPVTYRPGWFSTGNTLWADCPDSPGEDHPCGGDISAGGAGSLFYDSDGDTGTYESLPLDATVLANLPAGSDVRVTAIICPRTLADPTCLGAGGIPDPGDTASESVKFSIWVLAYGYSDCNDDDADGTIELEDECRGNAHVAVPFGSIQNFKGSPTVPLVSKNTMPGAGTSEVVPNPNGGGIGVPLSIWANATTGNECPPLNSDGTVGDTIEVAGNFTTCELHEWYAMDVRPADSKCAFGPGQCSCSINDGETISYRTGSEEVIGIDVMADPLFPCDLFEFYFGVPSSQYQLIKSNAKVIDDCSILDEESTGFYWYSDPDNANNPSCDIGDVGSINNPIILVSASSNQTTLNGNSDFFGILYISDVEDPEGDATFKPGGGATVHGAAIVDVLFPPSNLGGTFRVLYDQGALFSAGGAGSLGGLAGGWRDFGLPDIAWD